MLESFPIHSKKLNLSDEKLSELEEGSILHAQIVAQSTNAIRLAPLYGFLTSIMYKMRSILFILYALEFTSDEILISWFIDLDWIIDGIVAWIILYLTDIWRYDYMIIIGAGVNVITCFFEATSWSFIVLAITWAISDQPTETMFCAYITHILPVNLSKEYISYFYQSTRFGFGLAPILGGIIVYYTNYRTVYWVAFGFALACLVISIFMFAHLNQNKLEESQLSIENLYHEYKITDDDINTYTDIARHATGAGDTINISKDSKWLFSRDFRFPVVLSRQLQQSGEETGTNRIVNRDEETFGRYQWFLIILVSCQYGLINANVILISVYHTVFMTHKYNCNIIISTAQVSVVYICWAIGMKIIQFIDKKKSEKKDSVRKYDLNNYLMIVSIVGYIICIIITIVIVYFCQILGIDDNYAVSYFVMFIIYGTVMGILFMIHNILIILIQPRMRSGTTAGVKATILFIASALSLTIVGILFTQQSKEWLFYWQSVNSLISLILLLTIVLVETLKQV